MSSPETLPMDELEWVSVDSSHIEGVAHYMTDDNDYLVVRFLNDTIYVYIGVPIHEFNELVDADSKGMYLDAKIKPIYPVVQIH